MATSTLRDRFWTRPVARALTSPSGILSLGAGAAVGIAVTAPLAVPLAVVGAVVGGAVGLGGRLALALPKKAPAGPAIDPFQVEEPWRHSVIDALQAKVRFAQAVGSFRDGPLKAAIAGVGVQIDEAVDQCWQVAQQGQLVADARRRIGDRDARTDLQRLGTTIGDADPTEIQARTREALQSQIDTATRLDRLITDATDQLGLLNARLDESVTRAIELSVSNRVGDASTLGEDVGRIVDELETLRTAIEEVAARPGTATPPPLPPAPPGPGTPAP